MFLKLSMFQCLAIHKNDSFDFFETYQKIFSLVQNPKLHPPGKLSSFVENNKDPIGSLSFKLKDTGLSCLLFKNSLKISGKIMDEDNVLFSDNPDKTFNLHIEKLVSNIYDEILGFSFDDYKINLINGSFNIGQKISNYTVFVDNFVDNVKQEYYKIKMPYQSKRGRFTALKLYTDKNSNSSIHFDHSGAVQMFGFKSMVDLILEFMKFKEIIIKFV